MNPKTLSEEEWPHSLRLDQRNRLSVSGVRRADSFDEHTVILYTDCGELQITGYDLHIQKLNLEVGDATLDGSVTAIVYKDKKKPQNVWGKLFK